MVPETTNRLGQAKVGPTVSYRYQSNGNVMIEPHLGLHVVWDFAAEAKAAGVGDVVGAPASAGVRGRSELGVRAVTTSGVGLDLSGSYDGIGSSTYSAVSGRPAQLSGSRTAFRQPALGPAQPKSAIG